MQMNLSLFWNADCSVSDAAGAGKVRIAAHGLFSFKGYAACPLLNLFNIHEIKIHKFIEPKIRQIVVQLFSKAW